MPRESPCPIAHVPYKGTLQSMVSRTCRNQSVEVLNRGKRLSDSPTSLALFSLLCFTRCWPGIVSIAHHRQSVHGIQLAATQLRGRV